jgi:calcineurin-like phosphoesterase family protein
VTTAVISDLHLGTRTYRDLLRRPAARRVLFDALSGVDRLVLLGDVLELRESPLAAALEDSTPFFAELGEAMAGREVVLLAGNHDYQLAAPLLDARSLEGEAGRLELEHTMGPPATGPTARIADALGETPLTLAYPGLWIRPDVYATHGHYLDLHNTVPTLERLAIGVAERMTGGPPADGPTPDDYEAALGPVYSVTYALAQAPRPARVVGTGPSLRLWEVLSGSDGRRRFAAMALGGVALPGAVALLNRSGLGPLSADLSGEALRRSGLRGMAMVVDHLGIDAEHVLFGHTHRSGPWRGDIEGWELPGGTRLYNTGTWRHDPAFIGEHPNEGPYWPGVIALVGETGPPELRRLLDSIPA